MITEAEGKVEELELVEFEVKREQDQLCVNLKLAKEGGTEMVSTESDIVAGYGHPPFEADTGIFWRVHLL